MLKNQAITRDNPLNLPITITIVLKVEGKIYIKVPLTIQGVLVIIFHLSEVENVYFYAGECIFRKKIENPPISIRK